MQRRKITWLLAGSTVTFSIDCEDDYEAIRLHDMVTLQASRGEVLIKLQCKAFVAPSASLKRES